MFQAPTANRVLSVARDWFGFSEKNGRFKEILDVYNSHKPLARGYRIKYTDEWCDAFVSAVAIKANAVSLIGTEVGVEHHVNIFKQKKIWIEDGRITPQVGDIIVFNWDDNTQPNDGRSDHIGFVSKVNGSIITCLEGNKNQAVEYRDIPLAWGFIRGYARPKYGAVNIDAIAKEVIGGMWGNGEARKRALLEAGYDYDTVQKRVNTILRG